MPTCRSGPRHWSITDMTRWDTRYEFDLSTAALGAPPPP